MKNSDNTRQALTNAVQMIEQPELKSLLNNKLRIVDKMISVATESYYKT